MNTSPRVSLFFRSLALVLMIGVVIVGTHRTETEARIDDLWAETAGELLREPIWLPELSYDAANALMLPLHYSFSDAGTAGYRSQFRAVMDRYLNETTLLFDENTLRVSQFSYLISQYLVLAKERGYWSKTEERLYKRLLTLVEFFWFYRIRYDVTFQYKFAGLAQRVSWKARSESTTPPHNRAVVDEEWFMMAIAGDLIAIGMAADFDKQKMLTKIAEDSCDAVRKAGRFYEDGAWRFQPGVWSTHPDFLYAGNDSVAPGLQKRIVADIGLDTGHAHRFPLWLRSLARGPSDSKCHELYVKALDGFRKQFVDRVLVKSSSGLPLLENFLDGSNGVYRYGYATLGESQGYGPNEMSGSLVNGWYAFLGGKELQEAFQSLETRIVSKEAIPEEYKGPLSSRERHPFFSQDNYWKNGFAELHVVLAKLISANESGAGT